MAKLPIRESGKDSLSSMEGKDKVFNKEPKLHLVAEVARYQMARRHRGTHAAQTRSFVSLSGAKPFAQKGTGRARQGDVRSPLLEGGGVIFPPLPRDHSFQLPKRARKVAICSVLSDKLRNEKLFVLNGHGLKGIKTKDAANLFARLGLKKAVVVTAQKDEIFEKSVRNLPQFKVLRVDGLNVYDLLNYDHVVLMKDAVQVIEERF